MKIFSGNNASIGLPGQSKTSGGSGGAKRESKNFFAFTFAPTETGSGETEYDHEFDEPQRLTRYYYILFIFMVKCTYFSLCTAYFASLSAFLIPLSVFYCCLQCNSTIAFKF